MTWKQVAYYSNIMYYKCQLTLDVLHWCMYVCASLQPSVQTLQDTVQFAAEQLQPDDTTLQSGFVVDISKESLSMEAPGLGVWWAWGGGRGRG